MHHAYASMSVGHRYESLSDKLLFYTCFRLLSPYLRCPEAIVRMINENLSEVNNISINTFMILFQNFICVNFFFMTSDKKKINVYIAKKKRNVTRTART
jgi:hypothetical protein